MDLEQRTRALVDGEWKHSWHWPRNGYGLLTREAYPIMLAEAKAERDRLIDKLAALVPLIRDLERETRD